MHDTTDDGALRLATLLTEALALADTLDMPLIAIHVDEALSQLAATPPATVVALMPDTHPFVIANA